MPLPFFLLASSLTQTAPSPSRVMADLPVFEFHSGFWMNLHHVLYEHARRRRVEGGAKLWGPPRVPLAPEATALSAAEREVWDRCVAVYAAAWVERDLLFDEGLSEIKGMLGRMEDRDALAGAGLPKDLQSALEAAAPIYRRHAWKAQDAANRAWVRAQAGDLRRLGPGLTEALSRDFASTWPKAPIRVELVALAGWAGAYTTLAPTWVVLGTADPRDQGDQGFEMLFHEASHGVTEALEADLAKAANRLGQPVPEDLWHAVLFDTVGEAIAKALPGHKPYAEVQGLWGRGWSDLRGPITQRWRPWLEGKCTYAEAVQALVAAVGARKPAAP